MTRINLRLLQVNTLVNHFLSKQKGQIYGARPSNLRPIKKNVIIDKCLFFPLKKIINDYSSLCWSITCELKCQPELDIEPILNSNHMVRRPQI